MPDMDFNKSILRLEEITKLLESGECSLEDAMKLFDEGRELSKKCSDVLEKAKQKIEVVK